MNRVAQESFFDLSYLKYPVFFQKLKKIPNKSDILISAPFNKKSDKLNDIINKWFFISQTKLYIGLSNNVKDIYGQINLSCIKAKFSIISKRKSNIFSICLSNNGRLCELFTDYEHDYLNFKSQLSSKVILTTFHEDYTVLEMIGKGSFARVYTAHKKIDETQKYAIKAFNKEKMRNSFLGIQQIVNEIKLMRQCNHKNLLQLYEVHETVNSIYLVIDLIQGGQLGDLLNKRNKVSEKTTKSIIKGLLEALLYLNQKNIMHRDIKPENILLKNKSSDQVTLVDFGLATKIKKDPFFKRCGTPGFVAPEILNYQEDQELYDKKCDIFSIGVIFHLLLTQDKLFNGGDYKEIVTQNQQCNIDFTQERYLHLSKQALDLLKQMLCKNPEQRISVNQALKHPYFKQDSYRIKYRKNLDYFQEARQKDNSSTQDSSNIKSSLYSPRKSINSCSIQNHRKLIRQSCFGVQFTRGAKKSLTYKIEI